MFNTTEKDLIDYIGDSGVWQIHLPECFQRFNV